MLPFFVLLAPMLSKGCMSLRCGHFATAKALAVAISILIKSRPCVRGGGPPKVVEGLTNSYLHRESSTIATKK